METEEDFKYKEAFAEGKAEGKIEGYNEGIRDVIKACLNCKDEDFVLICNQKYISKESILSLEPTLIKK
jgi:flagellar biosynthesis/type III secretory pathway protein FliH